MKRHKIVSVGMFLSGLLITSCNSGGSSSTPSNNLQYDIIVDAGSSGSRAYVYQIKNDNHDKKILDLFEVSNKIPLASFSSNPQSSGTTGIAPLLDQAIAKLNLDYNITPNKVTTNVLGTAGMRLIPESIQTAIYQNVASTIKNKGLRLGKTETITGQKEGVYSWADVNYLSGAFTTSNLQGIIEVGGASTQVAFMTSDIFNPNSVVVKVNSRPYNIYSISFLGLGSDQAREKMNLTPEHNYCYVNGYNKDNIVGNFDLNKCSINYESILSEPLFASLIKLSLVPDFSTQSFVGLGGIYYALNFWKMEHNPTQELLLSNINETCSKNYTELEQLYPNAFKLYDTCANATYVSLLLYNSLQINNSQLISTNKIANQALTWTLGYELLSQN